MHGVGIDEARPRDAAPDLVPGSMAEGVVVRSVEALSALLECTFGDRPGRGGHEVEQRGADHLAGLVAQHLGKSSIDEGDASREIRLDDPVRRLLDDLAILRLALAQGGLDLLARLDRGDPLDGMPDHALHQLRRDLALHEVVGCARPHGIDVDGVVAVTRQQDHGADEPARDCCLEHFETRMRTEPVVDQPHVVSLRQYFHGRVVSPHPRELEAGSAGIAQQPPGEEVVLFIVLDEEDADRGALGH